LGVLGEAQQLLPELTGGLQLRLHKIKPSQSKDHREELGSFAELLAKLARSGVDLCYVRSRLALSGDKGRPQGGLQK